MPISKTTGLTPSYDAPPPYTSVADSKGGYPPPPGPPPQDWCVHGAHGLQHANTIQYAPPLGPPPGYGPAYIQHAEDYQRLSSGAHNAPHLAQLCQHYSLPPFPNFGQSYIPTSYSAFGQTHASPYAQLHGGYGMGPALCAAGAFGALFPGVGKMMHTFSHAAHEANYLMHTANHVAHSAMHVLHMGSMARSALKMLRRQTAPMVGAAIGSMLAGPAGAMLGMQLTRLRW